MPTTVRAVLVRSSELLREARGHLTIGLRRERGRVVRRIGGAKHRTCRQGDRFAAVGSGRLLEGGSAMCGGIWDSTKWKLLVT